MLIQFRVKNFLSFKEEVVLDMRATAYKENLDYKFTAAKDMDLLKSCVIYGKNASGKSNIINALFYFQRFILKQMLTEIKEEESDERMSVFFREKYFLLSESINTESEFEIAFKFKNEIYQYGFSNNDKEIITEWLLIDNKEVFDRKGGNITVNPAYKEIEKAKKVRNDRLLLAMLDYYGVGEAERISQNIKDYLTEYFNIYTELTIDGLMKNTHFSLVSDTLTENQGYLSKVSEIISKVDTGIKNLTIEKITRTDPIADKTEEKNVLKTIHNVYDKNGNIVGEKPFHLNLESAGTTRLISFLNYFLKLFKNGGIIFIDEMTARLHPIMTQNMINLFHSPKINTANAQIVFTTHDTAILNSSQFRRDQIWFVDKDDFGISSLYSLSDFKINDAKVRNDATFYKDYLAGKYGAIPHIDYDALFGNEDE